ncbi:MAG: toll/interleukin-1 receptor domain-containing protein [Chloroflexi bacterium]|nr:toll/interleukin-1 receptor domain-containing protein [Chloroflexota bacterium]
MARHVLSKDKYEFDVFISHASEDKDDVARPLALLLQERGLRVWYDEFEFRIGDNLIAKLNAGIDDSRSGILILSNDFFGKNWTEHELNRLENLAVTDNRVLFPIWHKITEAEVRGYRASLADIFGRSTATHTVIEIAKEIYEIISEFDVLDFGR